MIKNLKRTWETKLGALALEGVACLSIGICNDATAFVFLTLLAIPMFFSKNSND